MDDLGDRSVGLVLLSWVTDTGRGRRSAGICSRAGDPKRNLFTLYLLQCGRLAQWSTWSFTPLSGVFLHDQLQYNEQ